MLAGLLVIYAAGVTWLGLFAVAADGAAIGMSAAFLAGVYPFIVPDLIKLAIAAGLVPACGVAAALCQIGAARPASRSMRTALTIAGSDSGAGAGIQADLKTFAAHGVYGTSAITAVTAQNSLGVTMVEALPADLVTAQIEAVVSDFGVHAAKTGMLANAAIVEAVSAAVRDLEIPLLVVDPVMIAKSGDRLLDDEALGRDEDRADPQAFLVTPNIPEAEALTNIEIRTDEDRKEAARRIVEMGASAVVIKGGHFPQMTSSICCCDEDEFVEFRHSRVPGRHTHGTGCTFAAAITAHLAHGHDLRTAIPAAQQYVAEAIRHAPTSARAMDRSGTSSSSKSKFEVGRIGTASGDPSHARSGSTNSELHVAILD